MPPIFFELPCDKFVPVVCDEGPPSSGIDSNQKFDQKKEDKGVVHLGWLSFLEVSGLNGLWSAHGDRTSYDENPRIGLEKSSGNGGLEDVPFRRVYFGVPYWFCGEYNIIHNSAESVDEPHA